MTLIPTNPRRLISGDCMRSLTGVGASGPMSEQVSSKQVVKISDYVTLSPPKPSERPEWSAPECLRGHHISPASNVYSFGVILYELLTRELPYPGLHPIEVIKGVTAAHLRPKLNVEIPPALANLLERCWAEAPTARPSFVEVVAELNRFADTSAAALPVSSRGRSLSVAPLPIPVPSPDAQWAIHPEQSVHPEQADSPPVYQSRYPRCHPRPSVVLKPLRQRSLHRCLGPLLLRRQERPRPRHFSENYQALHFTQMVGRKKKGGRKPKQRSPSPSSSPDSEPGEDEMRDCPHLSAISVEKVVKILHNPTKWACRECGTTDSCWCCMTCGRVGCGRSQEKHAEKHAEATKHPLAMEIGSQAVHCYSCDNWVINDSSEITLLRECLSSTQTQPGVRTRHQVTAPPTPPPSSAQEPLSSPERPEVDVREEDLLFTAKSFYELNLISHAFGLWKLFVRQAKGEVDSIISSCPPPDVDVPTVFSPPPPVYATPEQPVETPTPTPTCVPTPLRPIAPTVSSASPFRDAPTPDLSVQVVIPASEQVSPTPVTPRLPQVAVSPAPMPPSPPRPPVEVPPPPDLCGGEAVAPTPAPLPLAAASQLDAPLPQQEPPPSHAHAVLSAAAPVPPSGSSAASLPVPPPVPTGSPAAEETAPLLFILLSTPIQSSPPSPLPLLPPLSAPLPHNKGPLLDSPPALVPLPALVSPSLPALLLPPPLLEWPRPPPPGPIFAEVTHPAHPVPDQSRSAPAGAPTPSPPAVPTPAATPAPSPFVVPLRRTARGRKPAAAKAPSAKAAASKAPKKTTAGAAPGTPLAPAAAAAMTPCPVLNPVPPRTPASPASWHRRLTPGQTGFRNLGNTCFLNSVMQMLSHTEPFRRFFLSLKSNPTPLPPQRRNLVHQSTADCMTLVSKKVAPSTPLASLSLSSEVYSLLRVQWSGKCALITPNALLSAVWRFVPRFRNYQQQDAHEFLRYLLDQLLEEVGGPTKKSKEKTALEALFQGRLATRVTCLACGHASTTMDPFLDLSVDIPSREEQAAVAAAAAAAALPCPSPSLMTPAAAQTPPPMLTRKRARSGSAGGLSPTTAPPAATSVTAPAPPPPTKSAQTRAAAHGGRKRAASASPAAAAPATPSSVSSAGATPRPGRGRTRRLSGPDRGGVSSSGDERQGRVLGGSPAALLTEQQDGSMALAQPAAIPPATAASPAGCLLTSPVGSLASSVCSSVASASSCRSRSSAAVASSAEEEDSKAKKRGRRGSTKSSAAGASRTRAAAAAKAKTTSKPAASPKKKAPAKKPAATKAKAKTKAKEVLSDYHCDHCGARAGATLETVIQQAPGCSASI
ncbi:putative ubiquitin carboxyl-terminal hydrolase 44 [Paratrimastix pyriformis]|uniref:Ubiquitin carboxyl-terminal hydrolase 44 n=1 Tax=Paratrimastix pyriformis TaxID=342808 RepID=A0ABQ8UIZ4_9EUKA|nr:putative ubiquitin carboxyl-terminal hydrolase 44 [Paratrimastix pyriformis]